MRQPLTGMGLHQQTWLIDRELKQLTKAAEKKSKAGKKAPVYSGSPHMRKIVLHEDGGVGGQEEDHCQVQQPCGGEESRVEESWR